MKLDDFELGIPTAEDGRKLRLLWSKHLFDEAQKNAWILWIKIGSSVTVALAGAMTLWATMHGAGK